jgi:hypothetical protein
MLIPKIISYCVVSYFISKVSSLFSCLIKSGTLTKLSKNSSPNHFEEIYILTVSKLRIEGGFNWLVVSEEAISN